MSDIASHQSSQISSKNLMNKFKQDKSGLVLFEMKDLSELCYYSAEVRLDNDIFDSDMSQQRTEN